MKSSIKEIKMEERFSDIKDRNPEVIQWEKERDLSMKKKERKNSMRTT